MASVASSVKKFLHTKDFYHWIKDPSGDNAPATFYWFSIVFYYPMIGQSSDPFFFGQDLANNLERLRYSTQQITLPKINYTGYNSQGQAGNDSATIDTSNMFGTYTVLGNSYLGISQKTITFKILNTYSPIIEKFLYPWMIKCLQPSVDNELGSGASGSNFPRLDLAINFWKPNCLYEDMGDTATSSICPEFIYYVKGIFPSSIEAYNPIQNASGADNNRSVEFTFNQFVMIPNQNVAEYFKLGHLYTGSTLANTQKWWLGMIKNMVANAASAALTKKLKDSFKINKPSPVQLKVDPKLEIEKNTQQNLNDLAISNQPKTDTKSSLADLKTANELLAKELINSKLETKSTNLDLNIQNISNNYKFDSGNLSSLDENLDRVNNDADFGDIIDNDEVDDARISINSDVAVKTNEITFNDPSFNIDNTIVLNNEKGKTSNSTINFDAAQNVNAHSSLNSSNSAADIEANFIKSVNSNKKLFNDDLDFNDSYVKFIKESNANANNSNIEFNSNELINTNKKSFNETALNINSMSKTNNQSGSKEDPKTFSSVDLVNSNKKSFKDLNTGEMMSIVDDSSGLNKETELNESMFNKSGSSNLVKSNNKSSNDSKSFSSVDLVKSNKKMFNELNSESKFDQESLMENYEFNKPVFESSEKINTNKKMFNELDVVNESGIDNASLKSNYEFNKPVFNSVDLINTNKKMFNELDSESKFDQESLMENYEFNKPQFDSVKQIDSNKKLFNNSEYQGNDNEYNNSKGTNNLDSFSDKQILLLNNKLIGSKLINEVIDYGTIPIIKRVTYDDLTKSPYKELLNNKTITSRSYHILSSYAKSTNQDVKNVIKEYKSLSNEELNNFVISLYENSSIKKDDVKKAEIENDQKRTEIISEEVEDIIEKEKNIFLKSNEKITSSDLDGLF